MMSAPGPDRSPLGPALLDTGVMAILRADDSTHLLRAASTLAASGIRSIELALTTPGALDTLPVLVADLPEDTEIGVGTVVDADDARRSIDAGAAFLVAPSVDPEVITTARAAAVPCYPGALSPTEVVTAWRAGATAVKLFPASTVGPGYLNQLRGPLPNIPLIPTGGVGLGDIPLWVNAGSIAVGMGGPLLGDAAEGGDLSALANRAREALDAVAQARDMDAVAQARDMNTVAQARS